MKWSNIWVAVAGALIAIACVSCGSSAGGGWENGTAPSTTVASSAMDTDAIAAWYLRARQ